jgi:hypothetical protein
MKGNKTWFSYFVIALIVACVLIGVAVALFAIFISISMNSYASNK